MVSTPEFDQFQRIIIIFSFKQKTHIHTKKGMKINGEKWNWGIFIEIFNKIKLIN